MHSTINDCTHVCVTGGNGQDPNKAKGSSQGGGEGLIFLATPIHVKVLHSAEPLCVVCADPKGRKQKPGAGFMAWLCVSIVLVPWVTAYPRIIMDNNHRHVVKSRQKTWTRRTNPATVTEVAWLKALKQKLWVRVMYDWAGCTQFGWLFPLQIKFETLANMPKNAPRQEGYPYMSLAAFKRKYFNCTCHLKTSCEACSSRVMAIEFYYHPLGNASNPFPPRLPPQAIIFFRPFNFAKSLAYIYTSHTRTHSHYASHVHTHSCARVHTRTHTHIHR